MNHKPWTVVLRGSSAFIVLASVVWVLACNALTGESAYSSVNVCTSSSCALQCRAQGGSWVEPTESCSCGGDAGLCGGANGICCAGAARYCVAEPSGAERCSACTESKYECGTVCCEQQVCLDPSKGACGAPFGKSHQSCTGGLVCPIRMVDGTTYDADCCQAIPLPGGTFQMGRSLAGNDQCPQSGDCLDDEVPEHAVTLAPYALDRFEVTVGRFRQFANTFDFSMGLPVGAGGDANVADSGWPNGGNAYLPTSRTELIMWFAQDTRATWTDAVGPNENMPINDINWLEAFAFCVWDGGRLPTEAEWEFAAANGASNDLYPWGKAEPTAQRAVYDCTMDAPTPCAVAPLGPANVGSLPMGENRWGHRDLAGNVFEWTLDTWAPYPSVPMTNFADVEFGIRVTRGGAFDSPGGLSRAAAWPLRSAGRDPTSPSVSFLDVGVRCARAP